MVDISKCYGRNCPLKENCKRYTAPDSFMQIYTDFSDAIKREVVESSERFELIKNSCEYQIKING